MSLQKSEASKSRVCASAIVGISSQDSSSRTTLFLPRWIDRYLLIGQSPGQVVCRERNWFEYQWFMIDENCHQVAVYKNERRASKGPKSSRSNLLQWDSTGDSFKVKKPRGRMTSYATWLRVVPRSRTRHEIRVGEVHRFEGTQVEQCQLMFFCFSRMLVRARRWA